MALDPFGIQPGIRSGRVVAPPGWPEDATAAYVLGCDLPGTLREFNVGDYVEVTQSADFAGAKLLSLTVRLRAPLLQPPPSGAAWAFLVLVDGTEKRRVLLDARTRTLTDQGIYVGDQSAGTHSLALRLALVGT